MTTINFVPDDYIHNNESCRLNILYGVLLVLVLAGLVCAFGTIKVRQGFCASQERIVKAKMDHMHQAITQFDQLQVRQEVMMKNAATIAELMDPIPKSVLLAALTNHLPAGASLVKLDVVQKDPGPPLASPVRPTPGSPQAAKAKAKVPEVGLEQRLETRLEITGMASSDLQVASYIEQLDGSRIVDHVALVESKEIKAADSTYRQFVLTARLCKEIRLTPEDVEAIRRTARAGDSLF